VYQTAVLTPILRLVASPIGESNSNQLFTRQPHYHYANRARAEAEGVEPPSLSTTVFKTGPVANRVCASLCNYPSRSGGDLSTPVRSTIGSRTRNHSFADYVRQPGHSAKVGRVGFEPTISLLKRQGFYHYTTDPRGRAKASADPLFSS
jgi:hypothetical protein